MITHSLSNRLVFIFSLLGLFVSSFLLYEYSLNGPVICPVGTGCDAVRVSAYSKFLGISIPVWGVAFYLFMAVLSVFRSQNLQNQKLRRIQLWCVLSGFVFGVYLTFLEIFVIRAICFWCVLSFIISIVILLSVILTRRKVYDNRN